MMRVSEHLQATPPPAPFIFPLTQSTVNSVPMGTISDLVPSRQMFQFSPQPPIITLAAGEHDRVEGTREQFCFRKQESYDIPPACAGSC